MMHRSHQIQIYGFDEKWWLENLKLSFLFDQSVQEEIYLILKLFYFYYNTIFFSC